MTGWPDLPREIRLFIFDYMLLSYDWQEDRYRFSNCATVCREWQYQFENKTFESLTLDMDRLRDFPAFVRSNQRRRQIVSTIILSIGINATYESDYYEVLGEEMMERVTHLTFVDDDTKRTHHQRKPAFRDEDSIELAYSLSEQCQSLVELHAVLVVDAHYFFGWVDAIPWLESIPGQEAWKRTLQQLPFCYANITSLTLSSECDEYEGSPPEAIVEHLLNRASIAVFYCMPKLERFKMWGIGEKDGEPYGWCLILGKRDGKMEVEFYSSFDWDLQGVWLSWRWIVWEGTGQYLKIDKKRIPPPQTYEDIAGYVQSISEMP